MHQTHEFASCEYEGTFVLILRDFAVLAPVVGFVLQVVQPEFVCAQDEVVAQILVAHLGQSSVL